MPGDVPENPELFHITHFENLASILGGGFLWSDSVRNQRQVANTNIGHLHIKQRRARRDVPLAARGKLADYVPFNFCSRSVMLYAVHRGHQDYDRGQECVVHLVTSVSTAISTSRPWAFTDRHAELAYARYFDDIEDLDQVDWNVMPLRYWSDTPDVKEKRQAEFLVHEGYPVAAIESIAVYNSEMSQNVAQLVHPHPIPVVVRSDWYY